MPNRADVRSAPDRHRLSLQQKLSLLMATILVVVLATSLGLTYRALTRTSESELSQRVASLARQFGALLEGNLRTRTALVERIAHDAVLHDVLRARAGAIAPDALDSVRQLLGTLRQPADSAMPVELWTEDGRRVAIVGPAPSIELQAEAHRMPRPGMAPGTAPGVESVQYSRLFRRGGHLYYHVTAPVRDGAQRLGYVVQLRQLGGQPQLAAQLRGMLGADVELYVHNGDGTMWTTLGDGPLPEAPRIVSTGRVAREGVGELYAADAHIGGTPWTVTIEAPVASAHRTPRGILLSLALIGATLTLVGAAAAWGIGRRITQPIGQLTAAAEAMARGDYHSRVTERGEDEVVRLARSFNHMAGEVAESQRALALQYADARGVASELETAYAALQGAMRDAEEARDAAETANRAKSDFLAVMSHELRTPLNAIGGYVELIQMGLHGPVTDAQAHALTRVTRSHKHLLGLINDVLNFARLGAGKVDYHIHDVPLDDALTSVEAMLGPQIDAKGLRYERTACAPSLAVRADGEKLQQILVNLLSNAVKFTAAGGRVGIECHAAAGIVEVRVHDTGIGIPSDRLRAIFEPFVQVNRALNRPHEGVGLGLAISRDLAVGMGGELSAESDPGVGSVFVLRLPLARAQAAARATRATRGA